MQKLIENFAFFSSLVIYLLLSEMVMDFEKKAGGFRAIFLIKAQHFSFIFWFLSFLQFTFFCLPLSLSCFFIYNFVTQSKSAGYLISNVLVGT